MNTISPTNVINDWLAYRGRYVNVTSMLKKGGVAHFITIRDGREAQVKPGLHLMPRDVRGRCGQ